MDNHLRIERKENLRIERKVKTRGSTFQTHKEAKMATKSAKAAKTVLKTKNITGTKMLANTAKTFLRKCWSLLANAKERPKKGKWKQ